MVLVTLWVSRFVTTILTRPLLPLAGLVHVILVDEFTVTEALKVVPNFTVAPLKKPVPVRTTDVPPTVLPLTGATVDTVGKAL